MHFLGFVFFEEYSKEETSYYQAFGNHSMDEPSLVKQYQEISFNLFLDIFNLKIKIPDRFAEVQTGLLQFENYGTQ